DRDLDDALDIVREIDLREGERDRRREQEQPARVTGEKREHFHGERQLSARLRPFAALGSDVALRERQYGERDQKGERGQSPRAHGVPQNYGVPEVVPVHGTRL